MIDLATEIRAAYGLKTLDAIHLAAAGLADCQIFLTNDHRLDRHKNMRIDVIER